VNRDELSALRDALSLTLALPDNLRVLLAQWLRDDPSTGLSQAVPKPNGLDPHPAVRTSPRPAAPVQARARHDNPAHARAAERKLLAAMRERPGLSSAALAKVVGAGLSTTKERLRRMGAQELIEKAPDGRWRPKAEEPRPTPPPSS
jgi:hypothetical protein